MRPPVVSVVIPTYARQDSLLEAVASVSRQSYRNIELIVVDDCSPSPVSVPECPEIQMHVIRHETNRGPGAARNTGVAVASGDYVIFLDDDDLLDERRVEVAVTGIGLSRMHACRASVGSRVFSGDMRSSLLCGALPLMGQVMFRREDVTEFDPGLRVSEDVDWWIRMRDQAVFSWSELVGVHVRIDDLPRPGVNSTLRAECRRTVAMRHQAQLTRRERAVQFSRVSSGYLLAGDRSETLWFAVRAFFARPSALPIKLAVRAIIPRRLTKRSG